MKGLRDGNSRFFCRLPCWRPVCIDKNDSPPDDELASGITSRSTSSITPAFEEHTPAEQVASTPQSTSILQVLAMTSGCGASRNSTPQPAAPPRSIAEQRLL